VNWVPIPPDDEKPKPDPDDYDDEQDDLFEERDDE